MLALLDKIAPSVFAALDVTLRRLGGAPTYVLTDNEKTVTIEHVAGMAVRNPATVAFARFYGVTVCTCEPAAWRARAGRNRRSRSPRPTWSVKDANLLPPLTARSPSWRRRARCSAIRSTRGCIG